VAVEREEVVPVEHDVGAGFFDRGNRGTNLPVVGMLRMELYSNANSSGHRSETTHPRRA
ncbi:MAG: hypothetical protein JWL72_4155, partial [Ilumatobacteraceae bacterium]|nr:hypothetical protein [Ilumatobacteraceae bacterium]